MNYLINTLQNIDNACDKVLDAIYKIAHHNYFTKHTNLIECDYNSNKNIVNEMINQIDMEAYDDAQEEHHMFLNALNYDYSIQNLALQLTNHFTTGEINKILNLIK